MKKKQVKKKPTLQQQVDILKKEIEELRQRQPIVINYPPCPNVPSPLNPNIPSHPFPWVPNYRLIARDRT